MSNCYDRFVMIEGEEDSFETWQGLRGPYYTPSVSEDGTLSWTNNGGLPNPANVNIKGPPGPGVIPGGTTGQLLAKASDEDYDAEWIDPPEMDAGHVSYDKTETYPDESVGDELNTINDTLDIQEVYDTASGDIASFNAPVSAPLTSLIAQIEPVQDLHGYDAPWAAGAGKNKVNPDGVTGTNSGITFTKASDGTWTTSGTAETLVAYPSGTFNIKSGETYILNGCPTGGGTNNYRLDVRATASSIYNGWIDTGNESATARILTATEDATVRVYIRIANGYNADGLTFKPMIRLSSISDETFQPYANECPITGWTGLSGWVEDEYDPTEQPTFSVTWQTEAGTVYDGYIDVVSGELVATHKSDSKTDAWSQAGNGAFYLDGKATDGDAGTMNTEADVWCNIYPRGVVCGAASAAVDHPKTLCTQSLNGIRFMVYDTSWGGVANFNAYVAQNPIQIVYKLAQPLVYHLSPQQIETLIGNNTVFVDCGSVSVTYFAGTQSALDQKVDKVEGKGLSTNDYTDAEKTKLAGIEAQANKTVIDATLSNQGQAADAKATGDAISTLTDEISLKAPVIVDTDSGAIATYPDGMEAPMRSLVATIEPIQDLHGYDSPWAAGAGKNICPIATMDTTNGGYINLSTGVVGTVVAGEQYTLSLKNNTTATSNLTVRIAVNGSWVNLAQGNLVSQGSKSYTFTPEYSGDISLSANLGADYTPAFSELQLEKGSTATAYQPYSNECPISGRLGLSGKVAGKNLFDPTANPEKWITPDGTVAPTSGSITSQRISCSAGATFTVSLESGTGTLAICYYDESGAVLNRSAQGSVHELTSVAPANTAYMYAGRYRDSSANVQLEVGSSATSYEAPKTSNIASGLTYINGSYYDDTGNVVGSENTKRLGTYLQVMPGESLSLSVTTVRTNKIRVHEYDANKNWLRQIVNVNPPSATWVVSSDAHYIRYSIPIDSTDIAISSLGSTFFVDWAYSIGKNLFDPTANPDKWINASGQLVDVTGAKASQKIPCSQGDSFAVSTESGVSTLAICFYASNGSVTQRTAQQDASSLTATAPANTAYVISATYGESGKEVQLERGTSATAYEAYKNTVYGGRVDAVSGTMTVTHCYVLLDGTQTINKHSTSAYNGFHLNLANNGLQACASTEDGTVGQFSYYKLGKLLNANGNAFVGSNTIQFRNDSLTTKDEAIAYLTANPLQVVYPLATPQTYQLTPQQVTQLFGNNSVWVDCGSVTVVSPRDTKLYIDKKLG